MVEQSHEILESEEEAITRSHHFFLSSLFLPDPPPPPAPPFPISRSLPIRSVVQLSLFTGRAAGQSTAYGHTQTHQTVTRWESAHTAEHRMRMQLATASLSLSSDERVRATHTRGGFRRGFLLHRMIVRGVFKGLGLLLEPRQEPEIRSFKHRQRVRS